MNNLILSLFLILQIIFLPPLLLGLLRKTKARLQNRIGASVFQPFFDLVKLCRKGETLSVSLSWIFRSSAALNCCVMIMLAFIVPWCSLRPQISNVDIVFVLYAMAAARFFTVLAALDSGSPFGAFSASRELTLSVLLEPASMLALAALAQMYQTSDMSKIFAYTAGGQGEIPAVWVLSGLAIFLCSIVELSRMPIDDPTTHLELTMVHEALILEASGPNLALIEYAHMLKMAIMLGLVSQCIIHAGCQVLQLSAPANALLGIFCIFFLAVILAVFEVLSVKLRWRKNPDFIAYSLTMSLLACFVALGKGVIQ